MPPMWGSQWEEALTTDAPTSRAFPESVAEGERVREDLPPLALVHYVEDRNVYTTQCTTGRV